MKQKWTKSNEMATLFKWEHFASKKTFLISQILRRNHVLSDRLGLWQQLLCPHHQLQTGQMLLRCVWAACRQKIIHVSNDLWRFGLQTDYPGTVSVWGTHTALNQQKLLSLSLLDAKSAWIFCCTKINVKLFCHWLLFYLSVRVNMGLVIWYWS